MARKHINPLLVKSEVGQHKESGHDLPPESFVYGVKTERKPNDCAAQVLQSWHNLEKQLEGYHGKEAADYVAMNREGAKAGVCNAKEVKAYREGHLITIKHVLLSTSKDLKKPYRLPSDSKPNFSYGLPTRPSSPVSKVLNGQYAREWELLQKSRSEEEKLQTQKLKERQLQSNYNAVHGFHEHSANGGALEECEQAPKQTGSRYMILERDPKQLFQMKRFKSVPAKVTAYIKSSGGRQ